MRLPIGALASAFRSERANWNDGFSMRRLPTDKQGTTFDSYLLSHMKVLNPISELPCLVRDRTKYEKPMSFQLEIAEDSAQRMHTAAGLYSIVASTYRSVGRPSAIISYAHKKRKRASVYALSENAIRATVMHSNVL